MKAVNAAALPHRRIRVGTIVHVTIKCVPNAAVQHREADRFVQVPSFIPSGVITPIKVEDVRG